MELFISSMACTSEFPSCALMVVATVSAPCLKIVSYRMTRPNVAVAESRPTAHSTKSQQITRRPQACGQHPTVEHELSIGECQLEVANSGPVITGTSDERDDGGAQVDVDHLIQYRTTGSKRCDLLLTILGLLAEAVLLSRGCQAIKEEIRGEQHSADEGSVWGRSRCACSRRIGRELRMLAGRCRRWQRDEIDEASKKHNCSCYVLLLLVRLPVCHSAEEEHGHHFCAFG